MTAITFDTLKFANALKDAGVPPAHAEAEAKALSEVLEVNLKELTTVADLRHTEERVEARIELLEQRLEGRLIQLEQRMTIKLGGLMVVAVGIVATLVKLL